jgi:PTH1 family peptidyl-tRNA hydrolase
VKVIVGLGNPGQTYFGTRHNVGFTVVQALAEAHGVTLATRVVSPQGGRPAAVYGEYQVDGETVRLLMPLTMMNESGEALSAAGLSAATPVAGQAGLVGGTLLIVCDDVNLPLGRLRLRRDGGSGGHHGLESCLKAMGTEEVARLRIGVGIIPPPASYLQGGPLQGADDPRSSLAGGGITPLPRDLETFVLGRFSPEERPAITRVLEHATGACETWVMSGMEAAMNHYNRGEVGG